MSRAPAAFGDPSAGAVVAVDLGPSGVTVAVDPCPGRPGLDPVDVAGAEGPVEPAAVLAPVDGSTLVTGHEARRRAVTDPARYEPAPRRHVDEPVLLLGTRRTSPAEALGAVLSAALDRAGPWLRGQRPGRLVVTHPGSWGAPRRAVLHRAASGLADELTLLAEPLAVAGYADWMSPRAAAGPLAVLDVGAVQARAAVLSAPGPGGRRVLVERAAEGPAVLTGQEADELLLAHLVDGLRADDPAADRLAGIVAGETLAARRHRQALLDDVRAARERLSEAEQASVPLPGAPSAAWCSRRELEALLRPGLTRVLALLTATMAGAGVGADDLAGVWLVGGMARTPLLAALVHRELHRPATVAGDPRLVVVRGALAACRPTVDPPTPSASGTTPPPVLANWPGGGAEDDRGAGPGRAAGLDRAAGSGWAPGRRADDPPTAPIPAPHRVPRSRAGGFPTPPTTPPSAPTGRRGSLPRPRVTTRGLLLAATALLVIGVVVVLAVAGTGSPPEPTVVAFDQSYPLPAGWVPAGTDPAAHRSRIRPGDRPDGPDLVAVQQDPADAADPAAMRARIAQRYAGTLAGGGQVSGLDLDARVGDRDAVHYRQTVSPGVTVDWYVVLDGRWEFSVGCRHDEAGRDRVLAACTDVAGHLHERS